jgi:alkylation response protein AidB-like acyl-CoA dehydrogenase
MDILHHTEEHKDFRGRLRALLEREVIPHVDQWEAEHTVPKEVWKKMGKEGFLCTSVSSEYGGLGGNFIYSTIAIEELVRTNHGGLITFLHSDVVVPYIESFGSEKQKKQYLPGCVSGDIITAIGITEPDTGSDVASIATTAVDAGNEVVISGSKTYISNAVNCDLVVLAAKDPSVEDPYSAISLYLVEADRPGFEKGNALDKMGLHSQDTGELFFTDCRIPTENRLGEKGEGFRMLMEKLQQERLVCALWAAALAAFMLEWTIAYCRSHTVSNVPLSNSQSVQFALVEMATEVKISRTFLDKLVADHMEGKDVVVETSMAKYQTSDMAKRIGRRCLDLIGSMGVQEKCPIVRTWRDVQPISIFAGTNEIMKVIIAKAMKL